MNDVQQTTGFCHGCCLLIHLYRFCNNSMASFLLQSFDLPILLIMIIPMVSGLNECISNTSNK
jgi:hypothetical protein